MRIAGPDSSCRQLHSGAGRLGFASRLGLGMPGRESCPCVSRTRDEDLVVRRAATRSHPSNAPSWRATLHILGYAIAGCCAEDMPAGAVVGSKTVDKHSVEDIAGRIATAATACMLSGHRTAQDRGVVAGSRTPGRRRRTVVVGKAATTTTMAAHLRIGGASRWVDRISTRTLHFAGLVVGPSGGPSSSSSTSSTSCATSSADVVPCRRKPLFRVPNMDVSLMSAIFSIATKIAQT